MTRPLFRPAMIESRRTGWLGSVSLVQPVPIRWLTVAVVAVAVAAIVFLCFGEYTRKARVTGQLMPDLGLSVLVAPVSGVVTRVSVEEGTEVQVGDPLVWISMPLSDGSGADVLAVLRQGLNERQDSLQLLADAHVERTRVQESDRKRQLVSARRELEQIEREIRTRAEQVRLAEETVDRYRRISNQQYISQIQLNQQQLDALEFTNALHGLERQKTVLLRTIGQLEHGLRQLDAELASEQAVIRRDLASLAQERIERESTGELLLRASVAGIVTNRMVEPGQSVSAAQPMLSLLPAGSKLQGQLLVPAGEIGLIAPGQRVLLRYHAYPYQKFGHHHGVVAQISRASLDAEARPIGNRAGSAHAYYRVVVDLERESLRAYDREEPLRPGMPFDADILSETRLLYQWLFEPLYALRHRA